MYVYSSSRVLSFAFESWTYFSFHTSLASFSVSRFVMCRFRILSTPRRIFGTSFPVPIAWKLSFHSASSAVF